MTHGKLHYITLQCTPPRSSSAHLCNIAHSVSPAICLTCDRSTSSTPRAMAGSNRIAAAALVSIGVLVVMAMVAESSAAGVCNPNALYPCLSAIQGARPPWPSRQCCNVVKSVDKNCMCNQLKSSSFPAQMVNNGLQLPKKCGRTDLRGFRCGRYTFPF